MAGPMQEFHTEKDGRIHKIGIIGGGNMASCIAYLLMQTGRYSDIVLLDSDRKQARCKARELAACLPFYSPVRISGGQYSDLSDCGIIILAASAGTDVSMSKEELAFANLRLFRSVVKNTVIYNQHAVLITVTQPADLLTYAAYRISGYPSGRVIGIGTLRDNCLLVQMLAERLDLDSRVIQLLLIGEQGEQAIPLWSSARICGLRAGDFCQNSAESPMGFPEKQTAAGWKEVSQYLWESRRDFCLSTAEAVRAAVNAIAGDERTVLPVSVPLEGAFRQSGVCCSLPCILGKDGVQRILEPSLSRSEEAALFACFERSKKLIREAESRHMALF